MVSECNIEEIKKILKDQEYGLSSREIFARSELIVDELDLSKIIHECKLQNAIRTIEGRHLLYEYTNLPKDHKSKVDRTAGLRLTSDTGTIGNFMFLNKTHEFTSKQVAQQFRTHAICVKSILAELGARNILLFRRDDRKIIYRWNPIYTCPF